MVQSNIPADELKQAMKEALVETLHEQHELFRELFIEALEDVALVEAIKQGEQTDTISRERIFQALEHDQQ